MIRELVTIVLVAASVSGLPSSGIAPTEIRPICYSIEGFSCDDCPGMWAWLCNPNSNGPLIACYPADPDQCEGGYCQNKSGVPGPGCPWR
jgi:hypothetical protein